MKLLSIFLLCLMGSAHLFASEYTPVAETWDYATAMKKVSKTFTGTEGVVLHMGDSITYANQNTAWARSFKWSKDGGHTAEDIEILKWSHADKDKSNLNGWYLTSVDAANGRSETASSGVKSGEYVQGGHHGLPSAKDMIKKYNPQIAIVMLGTNDGNGKIAPEAAAKNVEALIELLLKNGTIPILSTIPPCVKFDAEPYNALYRELAKKHSIPMIDLYKDMMALAGDNWKTQMISGDGVHLTHSLASKAPTKDNLSNCGYLLRCHLAVEKIKLIRNTIIK